MANTLYAARDFVLISVPQNAQPGGSKVETSGSTDAWLEGQLLGGRAFVSPFNIPELKIGSLDSLLSESDELHRRDQQVGSALAKVIETLGSLGEASTNAYGTLPVNNMPVPQYLENFKWETRKYRPDRPVPELTESIASEAMQLDADLRAANSNHSAAKAQLAAAERKRNGDLSVKSLHEIVRPEHFILGSEHLTTVLIAVPLTRQREFEQKYEHLAPNVVPGSASIIAKDSEYALYNVHLFKKSVQEFTSASREMKCVPREFQYSEEKIAQLKNEHDSAASLEQRLRIELVRLAKAAYVDIFICWFHLKALLVFVESVLRYGLPPHFNIKIIAVPPKMLQDCITQLTDAFGYLGGNAFAKDKRGNIDKKDNSLAQYGALVDQDYQPFVLYKVTL